MAEAAQASPVVLDPAEDRDNTEAQISPVVPAPVNEQGTAEETPEKSVDKTEPAPVRVKPRPTANVPTDVSLSVFPPSVKFKSLQPDVTASVERASVTEEAPLTYKSVLEKLNAGETVILNGAKGEEKYVGQRSATLISQSQSLERQLRLAIAIDASKKAQQPPDDTLPEKPTQAFVTSEGKIDVGSVDPAVRASATTYAEGRMALDNAISPFINTGQPDIDLAVRQYFVDDFEAGEALNNFGYRFSETRRFFQNALSAYGPVMARSAIAAYNRADEMGTNFSDEWGALAGEREKSIQNIFRVVDENGGSPTAAKYFNDMIQERVRNDPNLTDEQKDYILYDTATSGEKFERELVNDEMAYGIMEESFMQMSTVEQWGVIFAENLFGGGIFGKTKNVKSLVGADEVLKFKKDNGLVGFGFTLTQIRTLAAQQGKKIKHSDSLLELGFYNKRIQQQRGDAAERIQDLNKQLAEMGLKLDPVKKALMESEIKNLQRLRRRTFFTQTVSPYMLQIIGPEATLAGFAVAGRGLSGSFGMDEETGEFAGLITGVASEFTGVSKLGRFITKKAVTVPIGLGTGLASSITPEGLLNPLNAAWNKLSNADMTIQDYERIIFEPKHGRPMSRNERKQLKAAFSQVEKMDVETRALFVEKLQEGVDLEDKLLGMFPEGPQRIRAAEFLSGSLAETLAVPRAINAYEMAIEDTLTKGIKKQGLGAAVGALQEGDRKLSKAQLLLNNFEKHVAEFGDPTEIAAAQEFILTTRKSLEDMEITLFAESEKLSNKINDMLEIAVEDVSTPLDEDFFASFLEVQDILKRRLGAKSEEALAVARTKTDIEQIRDASLQINKALLKRFENVAAVKDVKDLSNLSLQAAVESLVFARYGELSAQMDVAYEGFRDFVATTDRPKIDISESVLEMLRLANADEKNITTFFGPSSTFFSGFLGQKSMKMFNRMVKRTLDELPEEERTEMFAALVENGVDAGDLEMMLRENPVQFGLLLHQQGKINVFANSNIEEAEEFRRAFRDFGRKTNNPAVSREFTNFEKLIDKTMKEGDPEGFKYLKGVREEYTQLNDPLRPGSPLNRILSSKVGEKQTLDETGLSGLYKNKTPFEILGEVGITVKQIMSGTRTTSEMNKLNNQIGYLSQLFGTVGSDGVMRIDLRTEEGQLAMDLMEEVIGAFVYNGWAGDFLKRKPRIGGTQYVDPKTIGFERTIQNQLEGVNEAFNINVIDANGVNDRALVFNITDMLSEEKDIANLIQKGGALADKGKKVVRRLGSELRDASSANKVKAQEQEIAVRQLQDILKIEGDTTSFYDKYIGGFHDTDGLKKEWMDATSKNPDFAGVDEATLSSLFDHAVRDMTYQALMKKGQYGPVGTKAAARIRGKGKGLFGDDLLINGLASTEGFLAELENPVVRKNLKKFMGEDQIESLTNIGRYLQKQQAQKVAGRLIDQGMSAESALSRAYNIARGQVGITYVVSEVALRLLRKNNSDALLLALQSPDAARIMDKMLNYPDLVNAKELNTFDSLLKGFLFMEISRKGNEKLMLDYMDLYTGEDEPQTKEEEQ